MTIEGWLELKAQLRIELELLLEHPELLVFTDAFDRLADLVAEAQTPPRAQVNDPPRLALEVAEAIDEDPTDDVSAPTLELKGEDWADECRLSDATRVLVGLAADIHETMRRLDTNGASPKARINALSGWAQRADELALMDHGPRGDLLHAIVAFTRMTQHELDARGHQASRVASIFQRFVNHETLRAGPGGAFFIHGMAKKAAPQRGSWRNDWKHWSVRFDAHFELCAETGGVTRGRGARRRAREQDTETLEEVLEELASAHPDRVVVLPSALDSAREAADFRNVERAKDLLTRLVTDFLDAYLAGGDTGAREIFTRDEYASTESETTRKNARAIKLRTFIYEGAKVVCLKHLRIGNGADTRSGWRCYFTIEDGVLVIGHCGAHLDVR